MRVFAIDPGNVQSAFVIWDGCEIDDYGILPNMEMANHVRAQHFVSPRDAMVIEMIASYGMPVGASVFETCVWIGRFIERWGAEPHLLYRKDVKMHLCQSTRAKDSNIRQALIDRFGPPGTKKEPGITYGLSKDMWAAFAVAVTWHDLNNKDGDRP